MVNGPSTQMAFVEVDCLPTHRDLVVATLCRVPEIISIEVSARGRDLLLTVVTHDWTALSDLVLSRLQIDGILRHRTSLVTDIHLEASDWRLDALNRAQTLEVARIEVHSATVPSTVTPADTALIDLISHDGRIGFAELARLTQRNASTVRRQFTRLTACGIMKFRCEVSQESSRWPISCTWFCRVEPGHVAETVRILRGIPETRGCFSTTGESNFMFIGWARSVTDLLRIEKEVAQSQPTLRFLDSAVAFATPKRIGWFLDQSGCATGEVVVPTFSTPVSKKH
ncbi:Lrp/AsnC family transcriptional regulator [Rhodococcus wratislaviensis]|uniref:Lrp/AsnC family transcriptional regulator n=1 Tax=Rhodococcus wratislaviensis TaxID=44752 RepID=UPI001788B400|nr:Lrp/AsnC family transcriptional regulator [Rhodococcus wratislaviensis]